MKKKYLVREHSAKDVYCSFWLNSCLKNFLISQQSGKVSMFQRKGVLCSNIFHLIKLYQWITKRKKVSDGTGFISTVSKQYIYIYI